MGQQGDGRCAAGQRSGERGRENWRLRAEERKSKKEPDGKMLKED